MGSKGRPKWGKSNVNTKRSLTDIAVSLINYMELTKSARKYLVDTKRFNRVIDFRLQVEAEFCDGILLHVFKLSKAFIKKTQDLILLKEDEFKEEVKRFSDGIIPEQPTIITQNLDKEMGKIVGRDRFVKTGKEFLK